MEAEDQMSTIHLLKAYGEAMEMNQAELVGELVSRLEEKSSPTGSTLQRVVYHLVRALHHDDRQPHDTLALEASRNYGQAFKAFYQIFPYGKFAHFTANSVILDALPSDSIHIVDFDIGSGVQWPPLMDGLVARGVTVMRLTVVRWEDDENFNDEDGDARSEEVKMLLHEQARIVGLKLIMGETDMEDLEFELKKANPTKEWTMFNCMVGIPHMGEGRNAKHVTKFLRVAKECINIELGPTRGIIIFGDGIGWGKGLMCGDLSSSYVSIFEDQLGQFHALMESMEAHMPFDSQLKEARIAMDCLFLRPYVGSIARFEMWVDIVRESKELVKLGLDALGMKKGLIEQGREIVKECESLYWVCIEGVNKNQMVLGYKDTPLLKMSSWR
ncbi:Protein NODULATION SIGNALING PATHWAY 2 [Linum perenne]